MLTQGTLKILTKYDTNAEYIVAYRKLPRVLAYTYEGLRLPSSWTDFIVNPGKHSSYARALRKWTTQLYLKREIKAEEKEVETEEEE